MQPYTKNRTKYVLEFTWRKAAGDSEPHRVSRVIALPQTRTGTSNPGWRQQIRRHANATTGLSATYTSWESVRSKAKIAYMAPFAGNPQTRFEEEIWGDIASQLITFPYNPSDSPNSDAIGRATVDFYRKIREAQTLVSGPTFLGEARETLRMLRNPADGLRKLCDKWINSVRKHKKKHPTTWRQDLSNLWLEGSFGWRPLIKDAEDAMKAWNRLHDLERIIPIQGFGIQTTSVRPPALNSTGRQLWNDKCWHWYTRIETSTRLVKIRGAVRSEPKTGGRAQLELFGLTPAEFIPTAWELLPWSFLVDYFTNIGDIIGAGFTDTSNLIWCSSSTVDIYDLRIHTHLDKEYIRSLTDLGGRQNLKSAVGSPGLLRWKRRRVSRVPNFTLSVPSLSFSIPGSSNQLANIAALLGQAGSIHRQSFRR